MKYALRFAAASLLVAVACSDVSGPLALDDLEPSLARAGAPPGFPLHVTITFGRDHVGTTFFPPGEHDASFHAKDKITPRVTHLAAGGEVTFDMASFHGVAIYRPGTKPADIEVSDQTLEDFSGGGLFIPNFLINDDNGRLERLDVSTEPTQMTVSGIFNEPGRYLVICYVTPHFVDAGMYAYIDVR